MPAPDFAKVQRNVAKMVDMGAPERDIDSYLATEKVTPGQLRSYGKRAKDYSLSDVVESGATLGLADPLKAFGRAVSGEVRERLGKESPRSFSDRYSDERTAERAARDAYEGKQAGGGALRTAVGFFAGGPTGTAMNVLKAARTAGAVGGAAQGFGNAEGGPLDYARDTAIGAASGAVVGDLAARYVPRVINAASAAVKPAVRKVGEVLKPRQDAVQGGVEEAVQNIDPQDVIAAAQRQGVKLLPADVGKPWVKRTTAGIAQTLGAGPIKQGAMATARTAGAARDRAAQSAGAVVDETAAGLSVQRGAKAFMASTAERGGKLYDAIPINPKADGALDNSRRALAELTAGMESNPKLSAMFSNPRLKGYQDALTPQKEWIANAGGGGDYVPTGGKLSWQDMKRFRTAIGEMAGEARFSDDTTRKQLQTLYGALSADMEATARAQGPKAFAAFQRANSFWRGREKRIEGTLASILGENKDKGPQAVFEGLERLANAKGGDAFKLSRALRSLPADEANTVRATVIDRLGRAKASAQDATGEVFSPETFLTQWHTNLSPRAKAVLFNDPKVRADLDDIAKIAAAVRESNRFANTSNTGGAVNIVALLAAGPAGLKLAAVQYAGGKLLASPAFLRWVSRAPKAAGPGVAAGARAHVAQLSAVAARDPVIRNEVVALQQRLQEALTEPGRLAAEQDKGNVRPQPIEQGR